MKMLYTMLQNENIYRTETDAFSTFPGTYMIIIYFIFLLLCFIAIVYLYVLVIRYLKLKIKKLKKEL